MFTPGNHSRKPPANRTHVERLFLWSLLQTGKPLLDLRRKDAEAFMEFCLNPPAEWIGPVVKSRFLRIGRRKKQDSDSYVVNSEWRPFSTSLAKRERKLAAETLSSLPERLYRMSQGSVAQVFAVCGSFFQHAMDEGLTEVNPFRAVKQKSIYKQRNTLDVASRSLTQLQWSFVIETAELMASEDTLHERSLFIVATLFSMYLRISDLVGRDNWEPSMGDFRRDSTGNWWFHVVGKGNKAAKISVRDDYAQNYLVRYRRHLQLPPLPSPEEKSALITTLKGGPDSRTATCGYSYSRSSTAHSRTWPAKVGATTRSISCARPPCTGYATPQRPSTPRPAT